MPEINTREQRITLKLVYYGPALSGKTTNLSRLHDLLSAQCKGEMMTFDTHNDRTLFFDLLPVGFRTPSGWLIKARIFTVPGQVAHDGTRKAVLSRADGVVFVADSQRNQSINNSISFESLMDNAERLGLDVKRLPLVVQFNKRDLPDVEEEAVIASRWNNTGWPLIMASALHGQGIIESFSLLLQQVYPLLDAEVSLSITQNTNMEQFIHALGGRHEATL